jgi:SPP1 family predicted phage head-tail adaptor
MRIGRRDKKVTIQRMTQGRNSYNEIVPEWTNLYTVWAHLKTLSGKEALSSEQIVASNTAVFNIRYRFLTTQDRVLCEGRIYQIESLNELGRKKELDLICTTRENG